MTKPCQSFQETIVSHTSASPWPAALQAHLEQCAACRALAASHREALRLGQTLREARVGEAPPVPLALLEGSVRPLPSRRAATRGFSRWPSPWSASFLTATPWRPLVGVTTLAALALLLWAGAWFLWSPPNPGASLRRVADLRDASPRRGAPVPVQVSPALRTALHKPAPRTAPRKRPTASDALASSDNLLASGDDNLLASGDDNSLASGDDNSLASGDDNPLASADDLLEWGEVEATGWKPSLEEEAVHWSRSWTQSNADSLHALEHLSRVATGRRVPALVSTQLPQSLQPLQRLARELTPQPSLTTLQ